MTTPLVWAGVTVAGGVGAVLRLLVDSRVGSRWGGGFPYGTMVINLTGAGLLGLLTGLALAPSLLLVLGTGAMGGYTTFSTWMFETHRLAEDRRNSRSVANVLIGLPAGLLSAAVGLRLGALL
jgi:CrcB protein